MAGLKENPVAATHTNVLPTSADHLDEPHDGGEELAKATLTELCCMLGMTTQRTVFHVLDFPSLNLVRVSTLVKDGVKLAMFDGVFSRYGSPHHTKNARQYDLDRQRYLPLARPSQLVTRALLNTEELVVPYFAGYWLASANEKTVLSPNQNFLGAVRDGAIRYIDPGSFDPIVPRQRQNGSTDYLMRLRNPDNVKAALQRHPAIQAMRFAPRLRNLV